MENLIKREKTALVVWDIQEALVNAIFNKDEFLKNVRKRPVRSRESKVPIFYTKIASQPEEFESPLRMGYGYGRFQPDDIPKEVYPEKDEIVLVKNTASIFIETNFELIERNAGIDVPFFTGIATEMGVETSVRHAQNLGFMPVIVRDAVSSMDREAHERSLKNMERMLPVINTEEALKILQV